jgi:hypothetical protein
MRPVHCVRDVTARRLHELLLFFRIVIHTPPNTNCLMLRAEPRQSCIPCSRTPIPSCIRLRLHASTSEHSMPVRLCCLFVLVFAYNTIDHAVKLERLFAKPFIGSLEGPLHLFLSLLGLCSHVCAPQDTRMASSAWPSTPTTSICLPRAPATARSSSGTSQRAHAATRLCTTGGHAVLSRGCSSFTSAHHSGFVRGLCFSTYNGRLISVCEA